MPEVIERKLLCDYPKCGRPGVAFIINDGQRALRVILCDRHDTTVREAMGYGEPAPAALRSERRSRGLSDERLQSMIVPEDDD